MLALGIGLGSFGAAVSSAVYAGLSWEFSIVTALVGAVGPLVMLGCGVRQACRLPLSALA